MQKYLVEETFYFEEWLESKKVKEFKHRIIARIKRIRDGNLGDYKWFGDIGELRLDFGKGYRIYFTIKGQQLILLLCGGDKSSQQKDIVKAREILKKYENIRGVL